MRVLFYIYGLPVGGAEVITVNNLLRLRKSGVDVALAVDHFYGTFLEKKLRDALIHVYNLNVQVPTNPLPRLLWRLKNRFSNYTKKFDRILHDFNPDILYVHTSLHKLIRVDFPKERIIYTFHAELSRALSMRTKQEIDEIRSFANRGMSFFALSKEMESGIKEFFSTSNVFLIPNSVDVNELRAKQYSKEDFLKSYGIENDAFILGHIGRFHEVKNHEKIINVFRELCHIKPNSFLVLVGGDSNGRLEKIKNLTLEYGLIDKVIFLGVRDDATSFLGIFDAFILPSYSESFSIALVEAQAVGIRCVASDRVPEEVFCNDNCIRLPLDFSDEEWADALLSKETVDRNKSIYDFDEKTIIGNMIEAFSSIAYKESKEDL